MNSEDMIARLSDQMSRRRRVANLIALVGGVTMTAVVGLLWATEPGLPRRTVLAFGALIVIGLGWAAYGGWAVTRKTPLFALDRVVAAWMALAATSVLALMTVTVTFARPVAPALFAAVGVLLVIAAVNLWRARGRRAALLRRKRELGG
jgi:hypothetical protein